MNATALARPTGTLRGAARLGRHARLLRRRDFQRCYREGRREHGSAAVLHAAPTVSPTAGAGARLGITASRKVGPAVVRNRLRRWVRETFRQSPSRPALQGLDLVVHLKPHASTLTFHDVRDEMERLFGRIAARWSHAGEGRA